MQELKSNYMRAAELKIAKLDPINDLSKIIWLRFSAQVDEAILKMKLEEENELRNM